MEFFMSFRQYYCIQIQTKLSLGLQGRVILLFISSIILRTQNLLQFIVAIKYPLLPTWYRSFIHLSH